MLLRFFRSTLRSEMKMATWGYCRVSTADQDYAPQVDALVAAGVPRDKIVAEKISGASLEGRALMRLIAKLAPGDGLVATKLDRVGRSIRDVFNIVHAIADQGATFRVLDMPALDTADPILGKIVLNSLALTAELERYFIVKRTSEGRARAKLAGIRFGRKPVLTTHQMAEAKERRANGESLQSIARSFNVAHSTVGRAVNG
jgi:DNA invertase Pin-like site-specific DNA recombinase